MRKKKWVMRWQASLMPDPLMIPDATVFRQSPQQNITDAQARATEQSGQQPSPIHTPTGTSKKSKRSRETKKQITLVVEEAFNATAFGPADDMAIELDPAIMSFLQEEEIN